MSPLDDILEKLRAQNSALGKARYAFLTKESERKHLEATLILAAHGKSHAEKTTLAQSTKDWLEFHRDLARKESIYEFERFKAEIMKLEFQAQYLDLKTDTDSLRRLNDVERGV